jgi:hypothetical protein
MTIDEPGYEVVALNDVSIAGKGRSEVVGAGLVRESHLEPSELF